MDRLKNYNVVFSGLPLGKTGFEFDFNQSFFDLFKFDQDFNEPVIHVDMILDKKETMLELDIKLRGNVELQCDLTGDKFLEKIANDSKMIVKFGDSLDDTDVDVVTIPRGDYQINLAHVFFELALLSLPKKRIHPDVVSGESRSEMLELIEKYSIKDGEYNSNTQEVDPRWDKLKELRT